MSYPESKWGPLKKQTGSHLEKIGRPVVLENVSGGHFERKKNKNTPPPSFFPQRPDTKHVLFFTSPKPPIIKPHWLDKKPVWYINWCKDQWLESTMWSLNLKWSLKQLFQAKLEWYYRSATLILYMVAKGFINKKGG